MTDWEPTDGDNNDVPLSMPGRSGFGGDDYGERLARIEAKLEHMATREDLAEVKALIECKETSMLRWLLGILSVAAVSVVVVMLRSFM